MSEVLERRKFMKLFSGAAALTVTGTPLLQAETNAKNEVQYAFTTRPYLQNPTSTGITVIWLTNKPSHSWIQCWEGQKELKSESINGGLVMANNTLHRIRMENLKPGATYSYKVFSKEIIKFEPYKKVFGDTISSDTYSFATPDPAAEKVSMLVLNDVHDRPHSFGQLEKLNGSDPYDMVFLNGDMFDHANTEQQMIDHLINPCSEVFAAQKPFLFVRGNHETRGAFSYQLDNYFENIGRTPYFTFRRGPVFFIALDTGEDKEDNHEAYYGLAAFDPFREQQAAWLSQVLQSKEARSAAYRVVLMHIPPFHSGDWHGTMHCRKCFTPVFEKQKVDMVLSGHTHKYGVHAPQADHSYPIIIGGGPKEGFRTLIKLKADKKQLTVNMIADSGQQVGEYVLKPRKL
jgi:predicted phosphodiesterase